jgi:uncharacterized protein (TIGR00661 family)
MRVLYSFPATGFGHISRAGELVPILRSRVETDVLISGPNRSVQLPFDVQYSMEGLTFFAGTKGGIDFKKTFWGNSIIRAASEIKSLDLSNYDLVITDFEPISAYAAKKQKHPNCIELSHQSAVLHPKSPKPDKTDMIGKFFLNHLCPVNRKYGFHFWSYDPSIYTPVIRTEIRQLATSNRGHYCVYLPAYDPEYLHLLFSKIPEVNWHIFSQKNNRYRKRDNCILYPANNRVFTESFASGAGVLCGAGFETPAEALFHGKKLMVIPMKGQYEQQCNAFALQKLGVETATQLTLEVIPQIRAWINEKQTLHIEYPDVSEKIIDMLLEIKTSALQPSNMPLEIHSRYTY